MSAPAGPSTLWLARHEALLMRRDFSRIRPKVAWILLAVLAIMHLVGLSLLRELRRQGPTETQIVMVLAIAMGFIFALMLAKALTACVHVIHGRRDLDMLFSAPVPIHRIVAVRMGAAAFGTALPFLFLVMPFVNVFVAAGNFRFLGVYAVIVSIALVTSVLGLLLALVLLKSFGARRTEIAAQIVGAVFGALAFLLSQARVLLPDALRERLWLALFERAASVDQGGDPLWMWPGAAATAEPKQLLVIVVGSILFFAASIRLVAPAVAWWARASFGAPAQIMKPRAAGAGERLRFRAGVLRALFVKEWRLLLRNPLTIFHTLMKSLYLAPMVVVALRADDPLLGAAAVAGLIVAIALQLASALASNTMSGEDAPDLVAAAPISPTRLKFVKLSAALTPVLGVVALASLAVASVSPRAALWTMGMSALASAAAGLMALWHEEPPARTDLRRRQHDLSALTFIETALTVAFGGATFLAVKGSAMAFAPAAIGLAILIALAPRGRQRAQA
jgi:ABC-2 type transport system permease protein